MAKYGIKVAEENDDIHSGNLLRLDSDDTQFRYKKIIDIKFPIPAIAINTNWSKTIKFYFNEDQSSLGFIPAYEYYAQSYDGNWSIPVIPQLGAYEGSTPEAPFYKTDEYVTDKYFNIVLAVNNLTTGFTPTFSYPAYTATIRLIITFDNLATL